MLKYLYVRIALLCGVFISANSNLCPTCSPVCTTCPLSCKTCHQDQFSGSILCDTCSSGYTYDASSYNCYKCTSSQYYNPSISSCTACPNSATCCTYKNGIFTICGCASGYTLDSTNQVCYKSCTTGQYYDSSKQSCQSCPSGASCCTYTRGSVTICGCITGDTLDALNQVCYKSCSSSQYYDSSSLTCQTCPQWSSPCSSNILGVATQTCCCNTGYVTDPSSGQCVKTCTIGQYYDYTAGKCISCGQNVLTCNSGGILTCMSGYTLDQSNQVCYSCVAKIQYYNPSLKTCQSCPTGSSCCTYSNGVVSTCGCSTGYTFDQANQVCYKCSATQYYDSSQGRCQTCPTQSTCCSYTNGFLTICGCASGYTLDATNQKCYKSCTSLQYYDYSSQTCISCPNQATCCHSTNGIVTICGCSTGYTLDSSNGVCYKSCTSSQYYDPTSKTCISCPSGASCCTYTNGRFSICGCSTGYTLDTSNNICYRTCTSSQYYDPSQGQCASCPANSNCCKYSNGFFTICGCSTGYTQDIVNQVCYKCTSTQYYDSNNGVCTSCPGSANCCSYKSGKVTICGCPTGYTLDAVNQICYKSCSTGQYYDSSQQQCQNCPSTANCCTFVNGIVTICGCGSGQTIDAVNQICYKSCTSVQYYDSSSRSCQTCPTSSTVCTVSTRGVSQQSCCCLAGYTMDSTGTYCSKTCTSSQYLSPTTNTCISCGLNVKTCSSAGIISCNSGYTLDQTMQVCYKCSSTQGYNSATGVCQSCPTNSNCCTFSGSIGYICGCNTGYKLDSANNVCYKCSSSQYYSSSTGSCLSCPANSNCCSYSNGFLSICGCSSGYTLDQAFQTCYKCSSNQYYDGTKGTCVSCPTCATTCTVSNGVIIVPSVISGYQWDSANQICYKCTSSQYYDISSGQCISCPSCATSCTNTLGYLTVSSTLSGYTWDAVNQACHKTCTTSQYYDSSSVTCKSCPTCANSCTYTGGVITVSSVSTGYTWDSSNQVCIKSCSTTIYSEPSLVCKCTGYTIDLTNKVCYKCTSSQYYNPSTMTCNSCPQYSTCCSYINGLFSVCGCQSGYTLDAINQVCYKCSSNQYYDPTSQTCSSCPAGASCCSYTNGIFKVCGCSSGYTLDSVNQLCYLSCSKTQYYDSAQRSCFSCPSSSTCCTYTNGRVSICGCSSGQTIDLINQICYTTCTSAQYYDSNSRSCLSCPQYSSVCSKSVSGTNTQTCCCNTGFNTDPKTGSCIKTCSLAQYFDYNTGNCISCPKNAQTCTSTTILTCSSGYTLDSASQVCYKCSSNQYYNPTTATCSSCPSSASCCTYSNSYLSICGCSTGYTFDSINKSCYKCNSNQYYDQSQGSCTSCPSCATSCTYRSGVITPVVSAGYSWDAYNQVCYKCTSTQYYDYTSRTCIQCPSCAISCTSTQGTLTVVTQAGYTWDSANQVCYKCSSNQYYDSSSATCITCPTCATSCSYKNGVFNIVTQTGYSWDSTNQVCYKCTTTQYYNSNTATCVNCPSCATSCSYRSGVLTPIVSAGYSWDSYNQVCYKCSSSQYYDYTTQQCYSCPVCATTCSSQGGIIVIPTVVSGYTWDIASQTCTKSCATSTYTETGLTCKCSGYTIDTKNQICYKCTSSQYYNPSTLSCSSCPLYSTCCSYKSGKFSVCGCQSGYTLDSTGSVCYKCSSGQYYDPSSQTCNSCPSGASCCTYTNGKFSICGCNSGYTLDSLNQICYQSCSKGQYYDSVQRSCFNCPSSSTCCTYASGIVTICGCSTGQTIDPINQVCYTTCTSSQYYDTTSRSCQSCQQWSSPCAKSVSGTNQGTCCCNTGFVSDPKSGLCLKTCSLAQYFDYSSGSCIACPKNAQTCNADNILTCSVGYSLDSANDVCYKCSSTQYYDSSRASCVSCPSCANSCSVSNGAIVVSSVISGYTWDSYNQICYKCNSNQYYDASSATCQSCPASASCCKYSSGQISICGCNTGYTLDTINHVCYKCSATQYYDPSQSSCQSCPAFSTCCTYTNGVTSICSCSSGYTLDAVLQVCYKCSSNQYYDSTTGTCQSCPSCATSCSKKNGIITVIGMTSGYSYDSTSQVCYRTCTSKQYYDPSQQSCQSCPACASSCTYINGIFTVPFTISGYTWNSLTQSCTIYCKDGTYNDIIANKQMIIQQKAYAKIYSNSFDAGDCFDSENFNSNLGISTGLCFGQCADSTDSHKLTLSYECVHGDKLGCYNNTRLQQSVSSNKYNYQARVTIYGHEDGNTETYCTHSHLYGFEYQTVTKERNPFQSNLEITAHTMFGVSPSLCVYNEQFTSKFAVQPDTQIKSISEDVAQPCGYHVVYSWGGNEDMTFEINTNDSIVNAVNTLLFFIVSLMLI